MIRSANNEARRGCRGRRGLSLSACSVRSAWVVVMLIALAGGTAAAQPAAPSPENAALRDQIERRFDVVPLRDGVALVPKSSSARFRSVELSGDTIAIDGAPASGAEVKEKLGADADAVIKLSYLDAAARRALFQRTPAAPAAPQSPSAPPAAAPSAAPAPPAAPDLPERPRRRGDGRIRRSDRVRIGGSVEVGADEIINGDVVAVGGSARVDGEVHGNVVAVGGSVHLGPDSIVTGDVAVIGGALERDPSARIDGEFKEIGIGAIDLGGIRWERFGWPIFGRAFGPAFALLSTVGRVAVLCLLAALVILIGHEYVDRISARAASEPFKAGAIGILAQLLFLPVLIITIILLVATIVGIPLLFLIPFGLLALCVVALVGFTAVAYRLGSLVSVRLGWSPLSTYAATILGIVVIVSPVLIARLLGLIGFIGGPLFPMTLALGFAGFLFEYLVWTVGFGAVALAWFTRTQATPPPIVP